MPKNFTRQDDEYILNILHLRYVKGLLMREIAERYNVSMGTICGIVGRIRNTRKFDNGVGDGTMRPGWWK